MNFSILRKLLWMFILIKACFSGHNFGIPCPFTILLLRIDGYSSGTNAEKDNDLLKSFLINNENLLKLISSGRFLKHTKWTYSC